MTDALRRELVDFDQGVTDSAISAFDDGGVNAWWNRNQDGGFAIVAGRQACVLDGGLLSIPPIIVRDDRSSVAVVQLKKRIRQGIRHTEISERRPDSAQNQLGRVVASNNEAADHDIVAGKNEAARRNVDHLCRPARIE